MLTRLLSTSYVALVTAGLVACTPTLRTSGLYAQDAAPGTVLWVSETVVLRDDYTCTYSQSSDDNSGRHGVGTYQIKGRQLQIHFTSAPKPPVAWARAHRLEAHLSDSLRLTFKVTTADTTRAAEPIPYASIRAYDENSRELAGVAASQNGQATLQLARPTAPYFLEVNSLGYAVWRQAGPLGDIAYQIGLPDSWDSKLVPPGTVWKWRLRQRDAHLLLLRGPIRLLWHPN